MSRLSGTGMVPSFLFGCMFGSVGPCCFDKLFEVSIFRFIHCLDLDVACLLSRSLEQMVLVVQMHSKQESDHHMIL